MLCVNPEVHSFIQCRFQSPHELLCRLDRPLNDAVSTLSTTWALARQSSSHLSWPCTRHQPRTLSLAPGHLFTITVRSLFPHFPIKSTTILTAFVPVEQFDGTTTAVFILKCLFDHCGLCAQWTIGAARCGDFCVNTVLLETQGALRKCTQMQP